MTPEERKNHTYLGDGVYAEVTPDHLILRTPDHRDELCHNKIYLEGTVLCALLTWIERLNITGNSSVVSHINLEIFFKNVIERAENYRLANIKEAARREKIYREEILPQYDNDPNKVPPHLMPDYNEGWK